MEKIGVLGIGKLGICWALALEKAGYDIIGVDISEDYVRAVNDKTLVSHEPQVAEFLAESRNFRATTDFDEIIADDIRIISLMVATPTADDHTYDHSQVENVVGQLIERGKSPVAKHLIIGCTTMPGYCDELTERLTPYNYTVSYNPEFIAQGRIMHDLRNPDQVLIGEANAEAGALIEEIYHRFCQNKPSIHRMKPLSAEICKLATNCFLTTKISFANSIGDLAIKTGAEPDKILKAIGADSRIGPKYLGYGFGFGGPCFPRDNRALGKFADQNDMELLISKTTDTVNDRHLLFMRDQYMAKYRPDEEIFFDYVTYKKDSVLLIESQQLALAVELARAGRKVVIEERKVVRDELEARYPGLFEFRVPKAV